VQQLCVNMYYVMHMTGESQENKIGETYAKHFRHSINTH
jgi:heme/copper-type cytochrome/quinol oxidase subunit 4